MRNPRLDKLLQALTGVEHSSSLAAGNDANACDARWSMLPRAVLALPHNYDPGKMQVDSRAIVRCLDGTLCLSYKSSWSWAVRSD